MSTVAAILLAAGRGTRMRGQDKLTGVVRGHALLADRAKMMLASCADPVIVVLPDDRPERATALAGLNVLRVINPDAPTGMASSIRCGIAAVPPEAPAALIMPADMPNIETRHIDEMIARYLAERPLILRATDASGRPGSPTIMTRALFGALAKLEGDNSGRKIIKTHAQKVLHHPLDGDDPTRDLDTPEDWSDWRKQHENGET